MIGVPFSSGKAKRMRKPNPSERGIFLLKQGSERSGSDVIPFQISIFPLQNVSATFRVKKTFKQIASFIGIIVLLYALLILLFAESQGDHSDDLSVTGESVRSDSVNIETVDSLSFIFIGDIMGHKPQINSAFDPKTSTYDYEDVFSKVSPIIQQADFAIANLELTLSGKPYTGYPKFSSPDALAVATKKSGIDVLLTANNHSVDKGKKGLLRTIKVLDSLGIQHTGTFKDSTDRAKNNLLILSKNNIKVGLLNYTYGTNGRSIPKPTMVNLLDTIVMVSDIEKSKEANLDKLIVMVHWGEEYESQPSQDQLEIARFLFKNGADIIVGAHPHVLQKMAFTPITETNKERLIAYSLGNFVSDQRTRKRDGGAMLRVTLTKEDKNTEISDVGYYLTWVHKHRIDGKRKFEIIPCSNLDSADFLNAAAKKKMELFLSDARALLQKENTAVKEIKKE